MHHVCEIKINPQSTMINKFHIFFHSSRSNHESCTIYYYFQQIHTDKSALFLLKSPCFMDNLPFFMLKPPFFMVLPSIFTPKNCTPPQHRAAGGPCGLALHGSPRCRCSTCAAAPLAPSCRRSAPRWESCRSLGRRQRANAYIYIYLFKYFLFIYLIIYLFIHLLILLFIYSFICFMYLCYLFIDRFLNVFM